MKSYSEMLKFPTIQERFNYLKLDGSVGRETFGFDRYMNQSFYNSTEWKNVRRQVIIRDSGCEFGLDEYEIAGQVIIHHINPIFPEDIVNRDWKLFNLDNLVCVSEGMHRAIHYGDDSILHRFSFSERYPGDTLLWRKGD
jgi:hypothetical protein